MTALVTTTHTRTAAVPSDVEREILARIDRGGVSICEAELRYQLRWEDRRQGELLGVLAELEARGLIESALHFRLTDEGGSELPDGYQPPLRAGSGVSWKVRR